MRTFLILTLALTILTAGPVPATAKGDKNEEEQGPLKATTFSGLKLRGIGPALTSGRVGDIAVHPAKKHIWYVAVCSGGVWKTQNSGTTWEPIFDGEGSYSIGCLALDPRNPLVLWVGTGENNSQRSVSYGDGLYKSTDGGRNFEKVGLEDSQHIAKILIDPRDSDVVWVAAQGPLWNAGGDRGLYKTTDGGQNWTRSLEIDENTGVTDVIMDPRDPDVMYAAAYQRRRHIWTLIDGGPGSAIYKTTDGGQNWRKLTNGLPKGDMGRIGLALAPTRPDVVYAIIEAVADETGFYRSTDAGGNWEKMSGYITSSPQYYQEIFADPADPDRVYSMDTFMRVTEDGGRTWNRVGVRHKHVDDHALWIDPADTDHLVVGCDGGVYETWDRGETWQYKANLPVTQFYKITADTDVPFYNVYGGTQDNDSPGAPSRTTSASGISNSDWVLTRGGDGFEPQVDPTDPNIVYSQAQYGALVRYDRRSGEKQDIQPATWPGEDPPRWNWSSPLIISPHAATRLYYACQRIYRSDDRGDSWTLISADLSRQLNRNALEVMGRVWGIDTVAKNRSTSFYGSVVSLSESPLVEGLLYAGTDDGLIQVTGDDGATWVRHDSFKGVPDMSYVACVTASLHDPNKVFAAFDNHKKGDFKPYLLRSTDRGKSWKSIAGDLPERGQVHSVVEDHVNPDLLFAGTEFGVFFTLDGGKKWIQLKGGIPIIACRDLDIQRRENDLVVGTFGRGIYILDDYTPLRYVSAEKLEQPGILFPLKQAWLYIERTPLGDDDKGDQGAAFFTTPNPPFGAVVTYYLKDGLQTLEELRHKQEKELREEDKPVHYPDWDALRAEEREQKPAVVLTVKDEAGQIVRRLTGPTSSGLHRVAWDLRDPAPDPISQEQSGPRSPWDRKPQGPFVAPGTYTVSLATYVRGEWTSLGEPQTFAVRPLDQATLPAPDREALAEFQRRSSELQRAVRGAVRVVSDTQTRIDLLRKAVQETPGIDLTILDEIQGLDDRLRQLRIELEGDRIVAEHSEPTMPSLTSRVYDVLSSWSATSAPTQTQRENYRVASEQFTNLLAGLRQLVKVDLVRIEDLLEAAGAPWTPGRLPIWDGK
jgi:photosystem II stability/assembly factor-like uncharacterized protein